MRVYQVAREFYPLANAGGLKEVVTGISVALSNLSVESVVFIPRYGFIETNSLKEVYSFNIFLDKKDHGVTVYKTEYNRVVVYLIDFSEVAEKSDVYTYTEQDEKIDSKCVKGEGFQDTALINAVFQLAVLEFISRYLERPDIISLHDGHTGLIPLLIEKRVKYSEFFKGTKCFFTIHNAGIAYHQRVFAPVLREIGIIDEDDMCEVCTDGYVDPLASAVLHSNVLTVSPFYAEEILELKHEESSGNFGAFCNNHNISITGITNGVNMDHFSNIGYLKKPTVAEKLTVRAELLKGVRSGNRFRVWGDIDHYSSRPLFIFQNRITEQKGIDTLISVISRFLNSGGASMFVIMGQGQKCYEDDLKELAKRYHGKVCYVQGYDEVVAKRLFISSDFFVLTSRWEPCGLTDFEAQLAGSIPIVHNTGGLKKVIHGETGYIYDTEDELLDIFFQSETMIKSGREAHNQMTDRAYRHIEEYYSWDRVVTLNYLPLFKG